MHGRVSTPYVMAASIQCGVMVVSIHCMVMVASTDCVVIVGQYCVGLWWDQYNVGYIESGVMVGLSIQGSHRGHDKSSGDFLNHKYFLLHH